MMWWILSLAAVSFAQPPWYSTGGASGPPVTEKDRVAVVAMVDPALRAGKVAGLKWISKKGVSQDIWPEGPDVATLPMDVLTVIPYAIDPNLLGAEWDLVVIVEGRHVMMTLVDEGDGHFAIVQGGPVPRLPKKPASVSAMQKAYGTGPFVEGESTWDAAARHVVDVGLGLLSDEERLPLAGAAIRRMSVPESDTDFGAPSRYVAASTPPELRIFDRAVAGPRRDFVGTFDTPYTPGAWWVCHEAANAMNSWAIRTEVDAYGEAVAAQNAAARAYNASVDEYNKAVDAANAATGDERTELHGVAVAIADSQTPMVKLANEATAAVIAAEATLNALKRESPVIKAFVAAKAGHPGVTRLAQTSAEVSFAEAFALYKTDPEALKRVHPGLLKWFQGGGHIAAMR